MSMIFYIFLYCLTGYFVPYRPDKISIFPEFSSPQFFLYPWMPPEYFLRTYALQHPHRFPYRISRRYARKYVHVITRYLHFYDFTVPCCQYLFKQLLYRIPYLPIQYPFTIFRRPYKMISRIVNCMAHSFYAHAAYYTKIPIYLNPFLPVLPHGVSRVSFS